MSIKPDIDYLRKRIVVDIERGIIRWIDATKHHSRLNGLEAGCGRNSATGKKRYWYIKIDTIPFKRSHIVFLFANGRWPELQIDHINGDSLDDRICNLREVTPTQNAWNHKGRSRRINLPMGVRIAGNKYQARIICNKQMHHLGTFETVIEAETIYKIKRKEFFGEYA